MSSLLPSSHRRCYRLKSLEKNIFYYINKKRFLTPEVKTNLTSKIYSPDID